MREAYLCHQASSLSWRPFQALPDSPGRLQVSADSTAGPPRRPPCWPSSGFAGSQAEAVGVPAGAGFCSQSQVAPAWALPVSSCVTLGQNANLSETSFPICKTTKVTSLAK